MASLVIPESDYPGLAALLSLKEESMNELISILAEAPGITDANGLADFMSARASTIPSDLVTPIAKVVISLSYGRVLLDYSISKFTQGVCDAMEESGLESLKLGANRVDFEANLLRILSVESLDSSIKAKAVLNEYEHLICNARILTDLRPIFSSGAIESPSGMGIVHTLRIRYHETAKIKEFFVAMDGDELNELGEIIERAKLKEKSLASLLEKTGIHRVKT